MSECSIHAVYAGETGIRPVRINVLQTWCSEPYLDTERRTTYIPSRIQTYPLHHLTLPTSTLIVGKRLRYSCQCRHNGTFACKDQHHHVEPWCTSVVHDINKGKMLQTARCTVVNPTDSIAFLTINADQTWKQRKDVTRFPSHPQRKHLCRPSNFPFSPLSLLSLPNEIFVLLPLHDFSYKGRHINI